MNFANPHPEGTKGTHSHANGQLQRSQVCWADSSPTPAKILDEEFKALQQTFSALCERAVASIISLEAEVAVYRADKENIRQSQLGSGGGAAPVLMLRPRTPASEAPVMRTGSVLSLPGELEEKLTVQSLEAVTEIPSEETHCMVSSMTCETGAWHIPRQDNSWRRTALSDVHEETPVLSVKEGGTCHAALQVPKLTVRSTTQSHDKNKRELVSTKSKKSFGRGYTSTFSNAMSQQNGIGVPMLRKMWNQGPGGRHRAVFADVDHLKAKARMQMTQPEYDVRDLYKTSGCCQAIARSSVFENLTFAVIAVNAVWMGIESDRNPEAILLESPPVFQIAAHSFCAYFAVEWLIRLLSFAQMSQSLTDSWFAFDTILVVLTVVETWGVTLILAMVGGSSSDMSSLKNAGSLRLLRLLRLTRMGRILHLVRAMPEIMMIIKGMTVAVRSVFFTLVLLVIIIYVFAICFAQLTNGLAVGDAYFSSVPHSMETLLMQGTFLEDIPDLWDACVTDSYLSAMFVLAYILLATITLMNTLIGVLVKVISVVAEMEKEGLMTKYTKEFLEQLFADCSIEIDEYTMLSNQEFEIVMQHPLTAKYLKSVDVDVFSFIDFATRIFHEPSAKVSFPEFVDLILNLRGTNVARVKDIVDLRKFMFEQLEDKAEYRHQVIKSKIHALESNLYGMAVAVKPDLRKTLHQPIDVDD